MWRQPATLVAFAVLLVLLLVGVFASDSFETEGPAARSSGSPVVNGADRQWPGSVGTTGAPAESQPSAERTEAPGRTFIARLNLHPRTLNGRVTGYVVRPDDPSILNGTPLQPGDVLLEVDGLALDETRAARLAQDVGDYQDVFVRFERGNIKQEGMLPLGTR